MLSDRTGCCSSAYVYVTCDSYNLAGACCLLCDRFCEACICQYMTVFVFLDVTRFDMWYMLVYYTAGVIIAIKILASVTIDTWLNVTDVWMWQMSECDTCLNVTHVWMWHMSECDTCLNVTHVWMWHMSECDTCQRVPISLHYAFIFCRFVWEG